MSLRLIVALVFLNSIVLFSQENVTKHTIVKGETISSIAEEYEVKPSAIYKLNPKAKNLLKLNSVLLIPTAATKNTNSKSKIATNYPEKEHEVLAKETLYGIAKQYGITLKELNQANPTLESTGLKIGQKITIPGNASSTETATVPQSKKASPKSELEVAPQSSETVNPATEELIGKVLPKETKYSIARKYGITIQQLDKANPTFGTKALRVGQKITIPGNAEPVTEMAAVPEQNKELPKVKEVIILQPNTILPKVEEVVVSKPKTDLPKADKEMVSPSNATENPITENIIREVLPKESKYSIAKQYGITIQELDKANPTLGAKVLRVGQKITIPGNAEPVTEIAVVPQQSKELPKLETVVVPQPNTILPKVVETVASQPKIDLPKSELVSVSQSSETVNPTPENIVREVLPKETKYGIAKQYGITVQELERQNPEIKSNLPVGYKLNICKDNSSNGNEANLTTQNRKEESRNTENYSVQNTIAENSNEGFKNFAKPTFNNEFLDQLIGRASENIGTRYRTGGTSKEGFDCSGLMCTTFGAFDIKLPRTSREQSDYGTKINTEEAQKGDLIFFKTNGRSQINHVGMVVEVCEGEIKFIHASVHDGVIISSTKEKYYEKNFTQINRVLQ